MIGDIQSAVSSTRTRSREFTQMSRYYFALFEQLPNQTTKMYGVICILASSGDICENKLEACVSRAPSPLLFQVALTRYASPYLTSCAGTTCHDCNIFSVLSIFKYKSDKTNNKFVTSQSFLFSNIPTSSKRKRRIIVYGLVSRYGPQSVTSASG